MCLSCLARALLLFFILLPFNIFNFAIWPKVMLFLIAGVVCGTVFVYLIDGVETLKGFLRLKVI